MKRMRAVGKMICKTACKYDKSESSKKTDPVETGHIQRYHGDLVLPVSTVLQLYGHLINLECIIYLQSN